MNPRLQREIAHAVRTGWSLDQIEEALIDPAKMAEDEKAALWLYAEVLSQRRQESMLIVHDRSRIET